MFEVPIFLKSPRAGFLVILLYLLIALGYDLITPRGSTDWAFYFLAVLLTMRIPNRRIFLLVAAIASLFTVLGLIFSPNGQSIYVSAFSRVVGLVLIWLTVLAAVRWHRANERLATLEKAVNASRGIIFMTDTRGVFTFVNPAFTTAYGYTAAEVIGKTTPRILKSGQTAPEVYIDLWNRLLAKEGVQVEVVNKAKDGGLLTVENTASPILDEQGRITGFLGIQRDITVRRQAEEALRKSEASLAEAQQIAHVGNWEWNVVNGWAWWSRELYRIFGVDPSGPVPTVEDCLKMMHPDDRGLVEAALKASFEEGAPYELGYRIIRPEGAERSVHAKALVSFDEAHKPVRMVGTVQDITEQKMAEEQLKRLNRDLRTISECNQALVRATDESQLPVTICQILVEHGGFRMAWVGYAEHDMAQSVRPVAVAGEEMGYLSDSKITWADEDRGRGPVGSAIRSGEVCIVHDIHGRQNHVPWREEALRRGFASSIALPLIIDGTTLGALALYSEDSEAFDVSEVGLLNELANDLAYGIQALRTRAERQRAEVALTESEDRYRDLVEHSRDLICTHDLEGRLLSVNPEPTRILGYSQQELLSMNLRDFLPSDTRGEFDAYLERIAREGEASGLLRVRSRDGKDHIWEYNNTLRTEGLPRPIVRGLARDVTERLEAEKALKKTQQQLLEAQKMEAVGRLAGGVAHDFNNLLTVINGYGQLVFEKLPTESPLRGHLEEINRAGDRASGLTRQLLAFSRKQVVRPTVLNLNNVVEGAQKLLKRLIGEDIEFVTHLAEELGQIKADSGQVEQVIMNLVVNARDAMPKGGRMVIETGNTELGEDYARTHVYVTPGRYVMLALSDTGCGMDAETQSHIFEPFYTTKGEGKGTGLGLSTVFGIVKQSGGHVNVYSEPGRGTTFKVYFPRLDVATEPDSKEAKKSIPVTGTETVLLVEDEPGVRALAQKTLKDNGYTVLAAADPDEALGLFSQHSDTIKLLLTDVIMPGLNGKDLADHLKSLCPSMKVIFVSGYTADAIAQHGILEEGVVFLPKPFTPHDLLLIVRRALDSPEA